MARNITTLCAIATKKIDMIKKCFIGLDMYVNCILLSPHHAPLPLSGRRKKSNLLRGDYL